VRWYGVYPAKVTKLDGAPEEGHIKVQLYFSPAETDKFEVWARVATMFAGDDRGTFFLPDVDDEVLVAFYAGDVRRPYVIGQLWNGQAAPPETAAAANDIKVLKTRGGHYIEFDENGTITIQTSGENKVVIDDNGPSITIEQSSGNKIEVGSSGITMTASGNLNITASMVKIDAGMVDVSGMIKAPAVQTDAVIGTTYTPGAGNIW
jgi:uncharacterized protein involved in type VI secretion and phage assembly